MWVWGRHFSPFRPFLPLWFFLSRAPSRSLSVYLPLSVSARGGAVCQPIDTGHFADILAPISPPLVRCYTFCACFL